MADVKLPANVFDSSKIPIGFVPKDQVAEATLLVNMGLEVKYRYTGADKKTRHVTRMFWPRNVFVQGVSEIVAQKEDGSVLFKTVDADGKGCRICYIDGKGEPGKCSPSEFAKWLGPKNKKPKGKKVPPKIPEGFRQDLMVEMAMAQIENVAAKKDDIEVFQEVKKGEIGQVDHTTK